MKDGFSVESRLSWWLANSKPWYLTTWAWDSTIDLISPGSPTLRNASVTQHNDEKMQAAGRGSLWSSVNTHVCFNQALEWRRQYIPSLSNKACHIESAILRLGRSVTNFAKLPLAHSCKFGIKSNTFSCFCLFKKWILFPCLKFFFPPNGCVWTHNRFNHLHKIY